MQTPIKRTIIACAVMHPELQYLRSDAKEVEVVYLEQQLHRTPHILGERVQEEVDKASARSEQIILCYGLCSNGIVGIESPEQGLIITRAHDCITLFLGSLERYRKMFNTLPGCYYLTAGWLKEDKDPLAIMEKEYIPRMGRETAEWGAKEELKHYTHFALIDTAIEDVEPLRRRAQANAEFFKKQYLELAGDLSYLRQILFGPYEQQTFFFVPSGQKIRQSWYMQQEM